MQKARELGATYVSNRSDTHLNRQNTAISTGAFRHQSTALPRIENDMMPGVLVRSM